MLLHRSMLTSLPVLCSRNSFSALTTAAVWNRAVIFCRVWALDVAMRNFNTFCCLPQEAPGKYRERAHNRHNLRPLFLNFPRTKSIHVSRRNHEKHSRGSVYVKQPWLSACASLINGLLDTELFSWTSEGQFCTRFSLTTVLEFKFLSLVSCYDLLFLSLMYLLKRVLRANEFIRLFGVDSAFLGTWYTQEINMETWLKCVTRLHCKRLKNE